MHRSSRNRSAKPRRHGTASTRPGRCDRLVPTNGFNAQSLPTAVRSRHSGRIDRIRSASGAERSLPTRASTPLPSASSAFVFVPNSKRAANVEAFPPCAAASKGVRPRASGASMSAPSSRASATCSAPAMSALGEQIGDTTDKPTREILIEEQPHAGEARRCSRTAANSSAARTWSAVNSGKSATIASVDIPDARYSSTS